MQIPYAYTRARSAAFSQNSIECVGSVLWIICPCLFTYYAFSIYTYSLKSAIRRICLVLYRKNQLAAKKSQFRIRPICDIQIKRTQNHNLLLAREIIQMRKTFLARVDSLNFAHPNFSFLWMHLTDCAFMQRYF